MKGSKANTHKIIIINRIIICRHHLSSEQQTTVLRNYSKASIWN
jgi:hypothetical protein